MRRCSPICAISSPLEVYTRNGTESSLFFIAATVGNVGSRYT